MASDQPKISVLFVCLGNICRSTMAEGVFRSLTTSNPRIDEIDSAGTGAYHELSPPDPRTMDTLRKHGITNYDHAARMITQDDFHNFDYIFAMDAENLRNIQRMQRREEKGGKKTRGQVMLFGTFNGKAKPEVVVDPWYGADDGFEEVYEQVVMFSKNFLKDVVDKS
jgi:low molecular weight phosphotyrosine protein phosphatase